MPFKSLEKYDDTVNIIEQGFKLRRNDALPRALKQVKTWRQQRCGAIKRKDFPTSHALRTFYRSIEALIHKNVGRYTPKDGSSGPTPEQAVRRPSKDSIQSLEDAGRITGEQAMAAREIQRIVEIITAGSHPKCQTYQKGGSTSYRPGGMLAAETAYRWSCVYVPWHTAMLAHSDKRLKKLAELVIIDGISLDAARCSLRMSYERGHRYLTEAIDLYLEKRERAGSAKEAIARNVERYG